MSELKANTHPLAGHGSLAIYPVSSPITAEKRTYGEVDDGNNSGSEDGNLARNLPHKKRRPTAETSPRKDEPLATEGQQPFTGQAKFMRLQHLADVGLGANVGHIVSAANAIKSMSGAPPVGLVNVAPTPRSLGSPTHSAMYSPSTATMELQTPRSMDPAKKTRKKADAWKHRLYPFDGPSIEEMTTLFKGVDLEQHVMDKLKQMKDQNLAQAIKEYYCKFISLQLVLTGIHACFLTCLCPLNYITNTDKALEMDHNEYKEMDRPPYGTPDDIRPFLLSRHQLKSFNSDFLRSALRKIKVNKSFCILLRGGRVHGVPLELRNLGNEAFARSIRTHQIIAFFTRYHSLYTTMNPGKLLDLNDKEHKILLDCLKDIMRRVSAKKVIQQALVPTLSKEDDRILGLEENSLEHGIRRELEETSDVPPTPVAVVNTTSTPPHPSFDFSTVSHASDNSTVDDPITTSYDHVLAFLSNDARQAVESMVANIRRQVETAARQEICHRSFEEGRKAGREEGRIMGYNDGIAAGRRIGVTVAKMPYLNANARGVSS